MWKLVAVLAFPAAAFAADPPSVPVRDDAPPSVAVQPTEKPISKRVKFAGYWWDERPDGVLVWCSECNGPVPAQFGGSGVTVPAPKPQGSDTTTSTTAQFRGASFPPTSSPAQAQYRIATPTPVPRVTHGGTLTNCASSAG